MGEPDKKPILGVGRFAGLNREYSVEYSIGSARLGCGAAYGSARQGNILGNIIRLGWRLGLRLGSARLNRLKYGARGRHSSSSSGARGCDWATVTGFSGGACGSPRCPIELIFAAVSSYG
jgi:hypothetical protein